MTSPVIAIFLNADRGMSVFRHLSETGFEVRAGFVPPHRITEDIRSCFADAETPLHEAGDVNAPAFRGLLDSLEIDIAVVAGFSQIFGEEILSVPKRGTLNLHAGRLPQYRGGSPLNWQIINGEPEAGLSVILMDGGIDTGPVLAECAIPIDGDDTIATLHEKANAAFPPLTVAAIEAVRQGGAFAPQDETKAVYWHQRNDADGLIDWAGRSPTEIRNFVRALGSPYPGAFSFVGDRRVRVREVRVAEMRIDGTPGRAGFISGTGPYVICQGGAVLLTDYAFEDDPSATLRTGDHFAAGSRK